MMSDVVNFVLIVGILMFVVGGLNFREYELAMRRRRRRW
jgi:uncharacterized membrane protein YidH (DUF202 family)